MPPEATETIGTATREEPGHRIQRLVGFWVMWHYYGGDVHRLVESGKLSRAGVYQQRDEFRAAFHCDVADWEPRAVPGLSRMSGYQR